MQVPISYVPKYVEEPDSLFSVLQGLNWIRAGSTPRMEYYCNDIKQSYAYGRGRGIRSYEPDVFHPAIDALRKRLEEDFSVRFEACFLNRYLNQSDHLGWHSDDSEEIDGSRPIAIVSLGVQREICFRKKSENDGVITRLTLENGSLCLMKEKMQELWEHRIPKSSSQCGERISLTFRGFIRK